MDRSILPLSVSMVLALACLAAAKPKPTPSPTPLSCDAGGVVAGWEVSGLHAADPKEVDRVLGAWTGQTIAPLDYAKIEDALIDTGWFASARVTLAAEGGGCVIQAQLDEFPPVKEVHFDGATAYAPGALLPILATQPGAAMNRRVADQDAAAIEARYKEDGYEAARVIGVDLADGEVTFHIAEGHVARIDVAGARRTGARRVRQILGIRKGDVFNDARLTAGQGALYRTGLFSSVGYGVEPADGGEAGNPGDVIVTIRVAELTAPYSRTDVFADRGDTVTRIEARIRNVGAGHSLHGVVEVQGASPLDLANVGFDAFYLAHARAEMVLFRPDLAAAEGRFGFDADRVRGRERPELDVGYDLDMPSAVAAVDVPLLSRSDVDARGTFSGMLGWRLLHAEDLGKTPLDLSGDSSGLWGRGEIGFDVRRLTGLEAPSRMGLRAGVEMNDGLHPFSYLLADGEGRVQLSGAERVEGRFDAGALSGDVPYWRELPLGGPLGPIGWGKEIGFARTYGRGRLEAVTVLPRDVFEIAAGYDAAAWSGAAQNHGVDRAQSLFGEVRIGPEFARARAGVAAPLPGASTAELWWFVGLTVATPY